MSTQIQFGEMTIYIDNRTGQLYAESGDALYELNFGDDVTDEMGHAVSDLEVIKVFYPEDSEELYPSEETLLELIDDGLEEYDV